MPSIETYFKDWADDIIPNYTHPPILFVSGAQGIGKSTAMEAVKTAYNDQIAILGIDDFYLSKTDRVKLALQYSPQFITRGPPGTHDIPLLNKKIDELLNADKHTKTQLPKFSKIADDRMPESDFPTFVGRPEAIIIEGWLVGAKADNESPDLPPLNRVEALDTKGYWRQFQEHELEHSYAALWSRSQNFFHIKAPTFDTILNWRIQQEETTLNIPRGTLPSDRREWVEDFILYYERITRRMLAGHHVDGTTLYVDAFRKPISFEGQ